VKITMKRLSLAELKAKAGKNVVNKVESVNGGYTPIQLPPVKPMPCDHV
jgi:hypothetical protein